MKITNVLIVVAVLAGVAGALKYQNKKSEVHDGPTMIESKYHEDGVLAARIAADVLVMAEQAKKIPPTPSQSELMSNNHPTLPWRTVELDLPTQRLQALAAKARDLVIGKLKDPDSAKFRDTKVLAVADGRGHRYFFCGLVNAKNSFGGYTGYTDYIFEVKPGSADALSGGIGDEGHLISVRFDDRWWSYEADDACLTQGKPIG